MTVESVLLVDDEDELREIGEFPPRDVGGFNVRVAASGPEGLALALLDPPDLIILDVMMPGVDGPATFKRLQENPRTAGIPIIFLTARVQQLDRDRLLSLGAQAILAKPFNPGTLADEVRVACLKMKSRPA
jgi:CheY-like chemotaxis protein